MAEGSAAVALTMAAELGSRVRLGTVVRQIDVLNGGGPGGVRVTLADGESIGAEAVVCTIPAGPLREVAITGLSESRLSSLRSQRHALAAKVVVAYEESFWQAGGQTGSPRPSGCSVQPGPRAPASCRC